MFLVLLWMNQWMLFQRNKSYECRMEKLTQNCNTWKLQNSFYFLKNSDNLICGMYVIILSCFIILPWQQPLLHWSWKKEHDIKSVKTLFRPLCCWRRNCDISVCSGKSVSSMKSLPSEEIKRRPLIKMHCSTWTKHNSYRMIASSAFSSPC